MSQESNKGLSSALQNTVILRKLFGFLSNRDLINVSEVNKLWCAESRKYLRDHRKVLVNFQGPSVPESAMAFIELLKNNAIPVPFNGMKASLQRTEAGKGRRMNYGDYGILEKLICIKHLVVNWSPSLPKSPFGLWILQSMAKSLTLEQLKISNMPLELFASHLTQFVWPNLKSIELPQEWMQLPTRDLLPEDFMRIVLSAAPKLTELYTIIGACDLEQIPVNRLSIVKGLQVNVFGELPSSLQIFAANGSELQCLEIRAFAPRHLPPPLLLHHDTEGFSRAIPEIIRANQSTLRAMKLSITSLIMLSRMQVPPVSNVECIQLGLTYMIEPNTHRHFFRPVNLSAMFPKVNHVKYEYPLLVLSPDDVREIGEELLFQQRFYPVQTVFTLEVDGPLNTPIVSFLASLFPNVRELRVDGFENIEAWRLLCQSWSELKFLRLSGASWTCAPHLDAAFCGLDLQELEQMDNQSAEFLQAVHLVTFPSIMNLKKLRRLEIKFQPWSDCMGRPRRGAISELTVFLALARVPQLSVRVVANATIARELRPLGQYIKIMEALE